MPIVLGLFAGGGLHGAEDAPCLVAALGRSDVSYAGTLTGLDGIDDVIAAAALGDRRSSSCCDRPTCHLR